MKMRYLSLLLISQMRTGWDPNNDFRFKEKTSEDHDLARRVYTKQLEIVAMMNRAEAEILAGTDTPNPYCFPGFSLHDELALLVQSGLTPMEALKAATINPARFLGMDNDRAFGSLETIEPKD